MIESLVVIGVVNLAAIYVGRRALRALRGRDVGGCTGSSGGCTDGSGSCPAATRVAADIRRSVGAGSGS